MKLAPIIVFCYNRPSHVERTLEALSKNDLADQSVLYIYADGPKENATAEQQQLIADTRMVIRKKLWCKEVHIVEAEKNKGLKANIVGAVTEIVNKYGRVITLEDDIITSIGFLKYMNDALEIYKDDEKVMHISGYMWPHRWHLPETFFYELPYPGGGWATWSRAWKHYSDDTEELFHYWNNKWDEFNVVGKHLQQQLVDNYEGKLNTWFIKWHAVMLRMGGLTLYPGISLTNNIGFDETASNCCKTTQFDILKPAEYIEVRRKRIHPCRLASSEIYAFYQGRWYNKRRRERLLEKVLLFLHLTRE